VTDLLSAVGADLAPFLGATVPLWIEHYQYWDARSRNREGDRLADLISTGADALHGIGDHPKRKPAGEVLNAIARGVALAALLPGGVDLCGLHWCAEARHYGGPRHRRSVHSQSLLTGNGTSRWRRSRDRGIPGDPAPPDRSPPDRGYTWACWLRCAGADRPRNRPPRSSGTPPTSGTAYTRSRC
jgi:hypothetical protein